MKNILITTVTHGDEQFAISPVSKLARKYKFDWKKNNLKAMRRNERFFQQDLNRAGPGNRNSKIYEERLAKRLITSSRKYQTVIDIHGSTANCGIFALVSELSTQNIELAKKFCVKNIVLWPSLRLTRAPLSQFIPNCIEIECGPKNSPNTAKELQNILEKFLTNERPFHPGNIYIVTGMLKSCTIKLRDFELTRYRGEKFYPLLVDQYPGISCYQMQKLDLTLST